MFRFIYLQHSKLAGMFNTEAAAADNTSYNSSPSHNFLTSVDDTLRADNLSPSSNQGSPARSEEQLTELQPPSNKQLTELKPLSKPTSNISLTEFPLQSGGYSSFSNIKSDSSSPTYYNSLITPVAQAPENFSGFYTPTATSSTHCSTMTTPIPVNSTYCPALSLTSPTYYDAPTATISSSPSYYSSLDGITTPTSTSPSHYSSLDRMTTPTSASPSYYSSLDGMTTPTSASPSYYSSLDGMTTPTSTSPSHYSSLDGLTTPTSTSPSYYSSLNGMSSPTSASPTYFRPNSESHLSTHTQNLTPREYQHHQNQNNTSPIADCNPTSSAYTAPEPMSVYTALVVMFGMEAASAGNANYNSFPSKRFLTSVDDTLRADNLSPSSSQGGPAS